MMTQSRLLRRPSSQSRTDCVILGGGLGGGCRPTLLFFICKASSLRWRLRNEISRSNPR